MKSGLKTRLVLAFSSTILIPILVSIVFIIIFSETIDQRNKNNGDDLDQLFSEVKHSVQEHSADLEHPDKFFIKIEPLLKKYDIELMILSPNKDHLFNSTDYQQTNTPSIIVDQFGKLNVDIPTENYGQLSAIIKANSFSTAPFNLFKQIITIFIGSAATGIFVLVCLIALWTWYISKTILVPLKTIYRATEEVIEGNLDYPINYTKKDEIGRFIQGFDLMRHHLKKSIQQQLQYEKARKELIASISHDLRTPLSSIKGYVEGLEDGVAKNEEMQKRYLSVIKNKTNQLDRLIEDLFEFSKFELDKLPVERNLVNSKDFFLKAFQTANMNSQRSGVEMTLRGSIPSVCINIDIHRITQVLDNLFDNAVRYGGDKIEMEIILEDRFLRVEIKDNGQGIAPDDLPYIFNTFYRGEKSRASDLGGTGLGLAIAKNILKAHDGEIKAESRQGIGSIFTFKIPIYIK